MPRFKDMLHRNNRSIRDDRADAIIKTARLEYKRKVEDLEMELDQIETDKLSMLDLSPTNAQSLQLVSDFDQKKFCHLEKPERQHSSNYRVM